MTSPGRSFPLPRGHARSAHDAVNRLIGSNEYGWFQQDPSGAPINYGFSEQTGLDHREIIPDYTGSQQMTFDVQPSEMVTFDSGARSFGADLQGDFYIRQIRLVPHDQIHRVRQRNLGLYISATNNPNDYQEVPANQYQFTQNSDGSIEYFFATPIQAQYVKVKTDWDDRDFAAVMTDRYATFKNPADQLLQLVVYKTSQSQTFAYDKNGNRTELNLDGRASGLTYYKNANGGNLSLVAFDGTWHYKYDANGNLVLKAKALLADDTYNPGTGVWNTTCDTSQEYWTYDWDLLNRMTTAKHYLSGTTPTSTTSYVYDTSGLRVERTGSDGVTRYLYSTAGVLLQSQKTNGDRRTLAYLGSTILGWVDTSTGSAGVVSTRYYTATDQLGSVTAVMDVHGAILWNSEYTPFGQVAGVRGSFDFTGIYTGKDIDPDTGLYYFNARWYDADNGRFLSEDPAGQGTNWYAYASNSPLSVIDPSGLWGFNFGIGLFDIGFDSNHGFSFGFGFGAQITGNGGSVFGYNFSVGVFTDGTLFASASAGIIAGPYSFSGSLSISYNQNSGTVVSAGLGAGAFGFGFDLGTTQAWAANGHYEGGANNAGLWIGTTAAHVGIGYQWGWGTMASTTGNYLDFTLSTSGTGQGRSGLTINGVVNKNGLDLSGSYYMDFPTPSQVADNSDKTKLQQEGKTIVELNYKPITGADGFYHTYIEVIGPDGQVYIVRGGPQTNGPPGSEVLSDLAFNSAGSSPLIDGKWGNINVVDGQLAASTEAREPDKLSTIVYVTSDSFDSVVSKLTPLMNAMNQANVPYLPLTQNSNSFAFQEVANLSGTRPSPALPAPGWDTRFGF